MSQATELLRKLCCVSAVCALLLMAGVATAQDGAPAKSAAEVVKPHAYVSLDPVPRGKEFQVAVVLEISSGFHMNSHKPSDSYLIATNLTPQLPAGVTMVGDITYPAGKNEKFPFSPDKPLNVYTGSVTLHMKLAAGDSTAIGTTTIPMSLRYQACNTNACLPPVKIPVTAELTVAAAGAKSKAVHPELFAASK